MQTTPVTNEKLKAQFVAFAKRAKDGRPRLYRPFRGISTSIKAADVTLSDQAVPLIRRKCKARGWMVGPGQ